MTTTAESPELRAAKRLLDLAKNHGFAFQRVAPGPDGPLYARRETTEHRDEIYLGGFTDSCHATRARKSCLIVPGALLITARVAHSAQRLGCLTGLRPIRTGHVARGQCP